jgi:hypothetical protein
VRRRAARSYQRYVEQSRRNCMRCNTLVALGVGLLAVSIALFGTLASLSRQALPPWVASAVVALLIAR